MAKQHDKQFKLDAVQYYQDHKDLGARGCAENLGIGYEAIRHSRTKNGAGSLCRELVYH